MAVGVRTDAAGATHQFAAHLAQVGVEFSLGANLGHFDIHTALAQLPPAAWTPAYQAHKPRAGQSGPRIELRDGAWVAELTGLVDLSAWPPGTRLILRKERPHPGAQLRITDHDGMRVTGFLTTTAPGGPGRQLADLELRHRRHARVEASATVRTPGCVTSRSTTRRRTGSGWPSPRWPRICSPGAPAWRCPRRARPTNPNGCGCASWPWPGGSCAPPDGACSRSTQPGPGPM